MNAPPFPLNPNVGDWSGNWVWNGARWVASPTTGLRTVVQVFAASGPYMPSPGMVTCAVECIGGGGGGGSAGPVPNANFIVGGGGGGSGGYSKLTVPAALVRGGVMVTVGAGGTPGGQGSTGGALINGTGGQGGATVFGGFCMANGGYGGTGNNGNQTAGQNGMGGAGADPGTGDIAWPGDAGFCGVFSFVDPSITGGAMAGGQGGATMAGGAGQQTLVWTGQSNTGNSAADNTGSGGGGAVISEIGGGPLEAGSGGSGICIVTETCWGDRDQPLTEWRPPLDVNVTVRPPKPWPPHPPGPWWPPGWPPGWQPGSPWPPGWGPRPPWIQPFEGQTIEGQEFEAGVEPYSQDPEEDP